MEVPYNMAYKIQLRRGTAAQWQGLNPVLSAGEPGVEIDTGKFKIGNGLTTWNELDYAAGDTPTGEFAPLLHTHTASQITDPDNLLIESGGDIYVPFTQLSFQPEPSDWVLSEGFYNYDTSTEQSGTYNPTWNVFTTSINGNPPATISVLINTNGIIILRTSVLPANPLRVGVRVVNPNETFPLVTLNRFNVQPTEWEVLPWNPSWVRVLVGTDTRLRPGFPVREFNVPFGGFLSLDYGQAYFVKTGSAPTEPVDLILSVDVVPIREVAKSYTIPANQFFFNNDFGAWTAYAERNAVGIVPFIGLERLSTNAPTPIFVELQTEFDDILVILFNLSENTPPTSPVEVSAMVQYYGEVSDFVYRAVTSLNGQTGDVELGLNDLTNVEVPTNTTGTPLPAGNVLKTTSNDGVFRPGHPLITPLPGENQFYNFLVLPVQWQWDSFNNYWFVDLLFGLSNTTHSVQSFNINPSLPNGGDVFISQNAIRVRTFAPETTSPPVEFDVNIDVTVFKFPTTQFNGVVAVNGQSGYINIQNGYSQANVFENSVFIGENNGDYQSTSSVFLSSGDYVIDVVVKNLGIDNGELNLNIQGPNGGQLVSIPQNNYAFKSFTYFVPIVQNHQLTFTFEKFNGNGLSSNVEFTVKTLRKDLNT